jgi:hypothetical protein
VNLLLLCLRRLHQQRSTPQRWRTPDGKQQQRVAIRYHPGQGLACMLPADSLHKVQL